MILIYIFLKIFDIIYNIFNKFNNNMIFNFKFIQNIDNIIKFKKIYIFYKKIGKILNIYSKIVNNQN